MGDQVRKESGGGEHVRGDPGEHVSSEELVDYFSAKLTMEREIELDTHFAVCSRCAEEARTVRDLVIGVRGSTVEALRDAYRGRVGARPFAASRPTPEEALTWVSVMATVAFVAARARRSPLRTRGRKAVTETSWTEGPLVCRVHERDEEPVFTLESRDPAWAGGLAHFRVVDTHTDAEWAAGWVVLHPDSDDRTLFSGSTRIASSRRLAVRCQVHVELCSVRSFEPQFLAALRTAYLAALDDRDRSAWAQWAEEEVAAGRLSQKDKLALLAALPG